MSRLKNIKRRGERLIHRYLVTPRELKCLRRNGNSELARVFREALKGRFNGEEQDWRRRIEALRSKLLRSPVGIKVVDYGARSAGLKLSAEEMYRGMARNTTVGEVCRISSNSPLWGELIFRLVRRFRPATCLELGCSLGLTAAYQAAALHLNGKGRLITMEGAPSLAAAARQNLASLNLKEVTVVEGRFQDKLTEVLKSLAPIDFAFIDGHHDGPATLDYFQRIAPAAGPGSWLVFDDIAWSEGMAEAWKKIRSDSRISVAVDLFKLGICRLGPAAHRRYYRLSLG